MLQTKVRNKTDSVIRNWVVDEQRLCLLPCLYSVSQSSFAQHLSLEVEAMLQIFRLATEFELYWRRRNRNKKKKQATLGTIMQSEMWLNHVLSLSICFSNIHPFNKYAEGFILAVEVVAHF